jgi:predicted DNA-binding protein (MmcQ/YjbR family)
MFAVLGLDHVRLTFKCSPEEFARLIERPDIRPSPYLARYNWVMLDRLDALPGDEVKELVAHSYNMVAAKAPLKKVRNSVRKKKQNSPRAQRKARAKKH